MAISFNGIPNTQRVPFVYVEFDNSRAVQGASAMPYRNLVIGQRLATGTVAALVPTRVTNKEQAAEYFGRASMLHHMMTVQFLNNDFTETWAIALDDAAGGVKAVGSVTIATPPTGAGTLNLYIAGRAVKVAVAAADTANQIATALAAAITANLDLPVTAAVDGVTLSKVNITARHKGLCGNDIDLRVNYFVGEALPAGLTVTIVAMTGGTTNPDLAAAIAPLGDAHYNIITMPYTDAANLLVLETELALRWGPLRMIEGHAISAAKGTHGALVTLGNSRNSPHLSIVSAAYFPTPPYEIAAAAAGVAAFYGNIDPARPLQTLPLAGVLPPAEVNRFTMQENNLLLHDGIATTYVDAGGVVRIQRMITTYQVNPMNAPDISYLDIETVLTLGYLRYDFRNYILRKYPRHKLANDGTRYGLGQAVITPSVGKAEAIARFRLWEELGLVENIDQFKEQLICERNPQDPNRLDWMLPPDLVNQFRVGGVQIGFLL